VAISTNSSLPVVARHAAWGLCSLSLLFLARVLGQVLVALGYGWFLPPMPEWYSGLMPYPLLLPTQIIILGVMAWLNRNALRASGIFARPHPRAARWFLGISVVYALGMVVRYFVSGQLHPERRFWPPGSIPIVFHLVLASYLYLLGRLLKGDPRVMAS
jgi:hypothetical protein